MLHFIRGLSETLAEVSPRLAECYGRESSPRGSSRDSMVTVATRIIQQYKKYPTAFEEAMDGWGNDSDGLRRAALDLDLPFYTFVYGIPEYIAPTLAPFSSSLDVEGAALIGDIGEDIWRVLTERLGGRTVSLSQVRLVTGVKGWNEYGVRSAFFSIAFKQKAAYGLALAGADPSLITEADLTTGHLTAAFAMGVGINYALAAYQKDGTMDPRIVANAYEQGLPIEYLRAL